LLHNHSILYTGEGQVVSLCGFLCSENLNLPGNRTQDLGAVTGSFTQRATTVGAVLLVFAVIVIVYYTILEVTSLQQFFPLAL
jgi:hypothetical protein